MKKINPTTIIKLTISIIIEKPLTFLRFGLPLLIIPLSNYLFEKFYGQSLISSVLPIFIPLVLSIVVFSIVFVSCHRIFLMNDENIKKINIFRLGIREWNFFAWWVKIGIIIMILYFPLIILLEKTGFNSSLMSNIVFLPFLYIIARLSLVFPATAVEQKNISLIEAWNLSKYNGWQLTLLIGLVPWLTNTALTQISNDAIFIIPFKIILGVSIGLFELGLLSMSYAYLKGYIDDI